ncbi:MAG TPA: flagellar motor switch protein FliN [Candidatus Xenobia bacterium]
MRNDSVFPGGDNPVTSKSIQFGALEGSASPGGAPSSIDLLRDVPLEVQAQLGKTRKLVREILKLNVGSIVELDKEAGEPIDILVNNKLIARGEVVEIDGNYGVRITEITNR